MRDLVIVGATSIVGQYVILSLAKARGAVAVTTDRSWLEIDVGVKVLAVR